ncbi:hypothetical protein DFH07DRAFT_970382 [Mycena maculata]|uniref:Uncharacterized protein n=1 Tax=Mycena maculata TaxID=230809 RepID=A0AAD7HTK5_9AGAR|nr:hypothetical protein DFH07DRAFT_970382 [Mycena maculata]
MGSPKSKPSAARPKARPTVSASTRLFDAFNHPLAYSLGLHLLAPDSIIDYARPELKACVMSALPVLRYVKRNINLHDLNVEARVFYGGINRIMERLHTIPQEWYDLCVDEDVYPSDAASLIKVIPPLRTKISLGPGDHRPLGRTFANYDQSPSPAPEPGPAASSSRLIARVAAPTGLAKKRSFDSADLDAPAPDEAEHSEAEAPLDAKPARVRALREKKKARIGSPEALPAKPKKGKKGKEKADSNKIPDAPILIAARVQQAKGSKAGTPVQLNKILEVDIGNTLIPEEPCVFCILHRVECVPIAFGHGCLNCFLKGFRYCCHTATMSELIKFHVEFADRFAAASHTNRDYCGPVQAYGDPSGRHHRAKFGDEAFASRFSDSSSAVRNHLADLVAQFRGTYKSFKNLDMSDVDFRMPPRPLSTARALIDIARDPSESVEAVDVDADGDEEVESEEEVEESKPAMPPKPVSKPSLRPSAAKPVSTPNKPSSRPPVSKPASKPSPARPPSTRSRAVPKDKE